jgi:Heterokaryon incompatibility protein (HET)
MDGEDSRQPGSEQEPGNGCQSPGMPPQSLGRKRVWIDAFDDPGATSTSAPPNPEQSEQTAADADAAPRNAGESAQAEQNAPASEVPEADASPSPSGYDAPPQALRRSRTVLIHAFSGERKFTMKGLVRLFILQSRMSKIINLLATDYQHMCKTCTNLHLHQDKFLISRYSSDRKHQAHRTLVATKNPSTQNLDSGMSSTLGSTGYQLGKFGEIKLRSQKCPFCRLVIRSLEDLDLNVDYDERIEQCRRDIDKEENEISHAEERLQISQAELRRKSQVPLERSVHEAYAGWEKSTADFIGEIERELKNIQDERDKIAMAQCVIAKQRDRIARYERDQLKFGNKNEGATCFASFQIDGREVQRDASGEVVASHPRTRRIQLRWSDPKLESSYIVLVAPQPGRSYDPDQRRLWESDTLFLARSLGSASKNRDRIQQWLDLCCNHHGKQCNIEPHEDFRRLTSKAYFGVIDVAQMRLTRLPLGARYLALSYTWGKATLYTTHTKNIQVHQEPNGLQRQFEYLPRVVREAIDLVRSLNERYLWVDSLCIIQDNDRSWNLNSSVMDLVYGCAYATICAAEGNGAQVGLNALNPKFYRPQLIENCGPGLNLTYSHLAETYIARSKWNTRGWTFQERLLSRRCIIFVGSRVFFQCRSTALSEDIIGEQESAGWSIELVQAPLQMLQDVETKGFPVYAECVRLYSQRDLTLRRDILAAFQGMSNLLGRALHAPLHFGLPTSHFDLALLWSPMAACERREPRDKAKREFGDMKFPSWSWCGWSSAMIRYRPEVVGGCLANANQWLTEHTWIYWYVRDGEGNLRPIWDRTCKHTTAVPTRWMGYSYSPAHASDDYGRRPRKENGDKQSQFGRKLLEYPFGISQTDAGTGPNPMFADQPYLQFWTWSARLRLRRRNDSATDDGLERCHIEDYCGDWCGTIVLSRAWLDRWDKEHPGAEQDHEFIALSDAKDFSAEESDHDSWTYYIPREREQAEWQLFYVLLVTKHPNGISYREGLGKVFQEAFAKSHLPGKEWKEIILG